MATSAANVDLNPPPPRDPPSAHHGCPNPGGYRKGGDIVIGAGGGGVSTRVLCLLGQTFLSPIHCFRLLRLGALLVFRVSHKNGRPGQPIVGAETAFKWRKVLG